MKVDQKSFDDNSLALQLFGSQHEHLAKIEQKLDISIHARGNELILSGSQTAVENRQIVLFLQSFQFGTLQPAIVLFPADENALGGRI